MYQISDFQQAFADYAAFNKKLYADLTPAQGVIGVLGFGARPEDDPGHAEFLNEMEKAFQAVISSHPDAAAADELIDLVFSFRKTYEKEQISAYVFSAIEGMCLDLIPYLSQGKAISCYEEYKKVAIWRNRTPIQKKLLNALKDAARS